MSLLDALLLEGYRDSRDIWIALRADGQKGSGTIDDPYDGGTRQAVAVGVTLANSGREATGTFTGSNPGYVDGDAVTIAGATGADQAKWNGTFAIYSVNSGSFKYWMSAAPGTSAGASVTASQLIYRFDDRMRELGALSNTNLRIYLGPGIFETRGVGGPLSWQPKRGMNFVGSGIDVTSVKLVYASVSGAAYFVFGTQYGNIADYLQISDLTVDCNLPSQPLTPQLDYANVTCSAIGVSGSFIRVRRVKAINWGSQAVGAEGFIIAVGSAHPDLPEVVNTIIEDCICVQPNQNDQRGTTVIHHGGGGEFFDRRLAFSRGAIIRRNFVDSSFSGGRSSFPLTVNTQSTQSLTRNGSTATCDTTPRKHEKVVDQWVLISEWFGYFRITNVIDDYKFEFVLSSIPTSFTGSALIGTSRQALSMGGTQGGIVEDNTRWP